jgi:hypothetical protein
LPVRIVLALLHLCCFNGKGHVFVVFSKWALPLGERPLRMPRQPGTKNDSMLSSLAFVWSSADSFLSSLPGANSDAFRQVHELQVHHFRAVFLREFKKIFWSPSLFPFKIDIELVFLGFLLFKLCTLQVFCYPAFYALTRSRYFLFRMF